jgi:3-dehydroquinate synthase
MKIVEVKVSSRNYEIRVGSGLLNQAGDFLRQLGLNKQAVIITDKTVGALYGVHLKNTLDAEGIKACMLEVPPGEEQKSLETAGELYTELTNRFAERTTPILALGGGVIGDLAGFVAATYMRGVPLVQLPTTLLAQGDSSIGGKVAVNHGNLKNTIGTFYHPMLTISDVNTLKTLSPREVIDGLSEVIKHSIILDGDLFNYLETNLEKILSFDADTLENVIFRSAQIKASIVEKDEFDLGIRNILNYGHTLGHAVESVSNMKVWHGEAVAMGMVAEAGISKRLGILPDRDFERLVNLIVKVGLPVSTAVFETELLMNAMRHDKKTVYGKLKMALPKSIGKAVIINDVSPVLVKEVLDKNENP